MKHARSDYDRIQDPSGKIPDQEPVFLLRGQDIAAPGAVRFWAAEAASLGAGPELVELARAHAAEMERWQHHARQKVPDLVRPRRCLECEDGIIYDVDLDGNSEEPYKCNHCGGTGFDPVQDSEPSAAGFRRVPVPVPDYATPREYRSALLAVRVPPNWTEQPDCACATWVLSNKAASATIWLRGGTLLWELLCERDQPPVLAMDSGDAANARPFSSTSHFHTPEGAFSAGDAFIEENTQRGRQVL